MSGAAVVHKYINNVNNCSPEILPHMNVIQSNQEGRCQFNVEDEETYSAVCQFRRKLSDFKGKGTLQKEDCRVILLQLAHGVHHLHSNGRVHNEITEENIFFTQNGKRVVLLHPTSFPRSTEGTDKKNDIKDLSTVFSFMLEHCLSSNNNEVLDIEFNDEDTTDDLFKKMNTGEYSSLDILCHPYFWNTDKKLDFLCKVSQASKASQQSDLKSRLNERSQGVVGAEWKTRLKIVDGREKDLYEDKLTERRGKKSKVKENVFVEMADNHRPPYDFSCVQSLLSFIRNRREHFWESSLQSQACFLFDPSNQFFIFFCSKFPKLFFSVYDVVRESSYYLKGISDVYLSKITENTFRQT